MPLSPPRWSVFCTLRCAHREFEVELYLQAKAGVARRRCYIYRRAAQDGLKRATLRLGKSIYKRAPRAAAAPGNR